MRHKQSRAIAAQFQEPLQLERTDAFLGTAKEIPSNQPFAQRDFAILENRPDGYGELILAVGAPAQSGARLGGGIGLNIGKLGLVVALALWADNTVFPKDRFKMFARLVIRPEPVKELNQSEVFRNGLRFHAPRLSGFILPSSA